MGYEDDNQVGDCGLWCMFLVTALGKTNNVARVIANHVCCTTSSAVALFRLT